MQVKVSISGLDLTQDIGPIIRSFFPRDEIVTEVNKSEKEADSTLDVTDTGYRIDLNLEESGFSIYSDGEKKAEEIFSYEDIPDEHMSYEKRKKRAYKNQLLRALYKVLSVKTGKELPWGILTGVRPTKLMFEKLKNGDKADTSFMEKEYLCSTKKAGLSLKVAQREFELLKNIDYVNGYSLYVGFPFCPSICNYCSFGSMLIDRSGTLVSDYINALLKETEEMSGILKDKKLQTVYFGGGTPTAVSLEQLRSVIRKVKDCFDMSNVLEFTVEAGRPDSIDEEKLKMLKEEGITRISINPQSMRQKTLDIIGRKHTVEQTVEAFCLARKTGFDNINMDLIAGLSGECFSDMEYTLNEVGKLEPDSITVHTLALKRAAKLVTEKEMYSNLRASDVGEMVEYAADYCMARGYEPYYLYRQKKMTENLENIGYARTGKEGLYNILIMEEVQMILALGAGASSKFTDKNRTNGRRFGRVENVKNVSEYIGRIDEMIERKKNAYNEGF